MPNPRPALPPDTYAVLPLLLTSRLVAMAFAPLAEVAAWLERLGLRVQWDAARTQITIRSPWHGIRTGLAADSRAIDRVPALGFAVAGRAWPWVFPGLQDAVDQETKRRSAATRPAGEGEERP